MNSVLSICIPTYNRKDYLRQCLDHLLPQVTPLEVGIYISDNASTDGTSQLIEEYQKNYSYLFYFQQPYNKGIDINMLDAARFSSTTYAWWLGDDDIIAPNAISDLLDSLGKNAYSLVLLNAGSISNDLHNILAQSTLPITNNQIFVDSIKFFERFCHQMPFGSIIVNAERVKSIEYSRFIGSSHAYSGAIFDYLAYEQEKCSKCNILLIADNLVYLRCGQKSWNDYSVRVHLVQIPMWFRNLHVSYHQVSMRIFNPSLATYFANSLYNKAFKVLIPN